MAKHHPGKRGTRGSKMGSIGSKMSKPTITMKDAQSDTGPISRAESSAGRARRNRRLEKTSI